MYASANHLLSYQAAKYCRTSVEIPGTHVGYSTDTSNNVCKEKEKHDGLQKDNISMLK